MVDSLSVEHQSVNTRAERLFWNAVVLPFYMLIFTSVLIVSFVLADGAVFLCPFARFIANVPTAVNFLLVVELNI